MRWVFTGRGMPTYSPPIVVASVEVLEESVPPDVQVTFAPGSFKNGQIGALDEKPGLGAGAWQMRPLSRGYVEAKSNQPGDAPVINPRYLSQEPERRAVLRADDHDRREGRRDDKGRRAAKTGGVAKAYRGRRLTEKDGVVYRPITPHIM